MKNNCLYCYKTLEGNKDFHPECSSEFFGTSIPPKIDYSIDQMDELAKKTVERSVSVPGVQAKLSMSLIKKNKENSNSRLTVVDALGGHYILKPPSDRFPEMPENEHLTMRIAEEFGISVVPSSLIKLASGELSYITKRIDRKPNGDKIHMLDMFQITEAFDKYKGSMERVGKAIGKYSRNTLLDKILFLELTVFSFITGNNDMHLKNFSMIEDNSKWKLAPAYDLLNVTILFPEDKEELALTPSAKKKKLKLKHFKSLGVSLGLTDKQIEGVFSRLNKNKSKAIRWINDSFLSENIKVDYIKLLESRYQQLEFKS